MQGFFNIKEYPGNRPIAIWGAGNEARHMLSNYEIQFLNYNVTCITDNNKSLQDTELIIGTQHFPEFRNKYKVVTTDTFIEYCYKNPNALIVISSINYYDEIFKQISEYKFHNDILSVEEFYDISYHEFIEKVALPVNKDMAFYYQNYIISITLFYEIRKNRSILEYIHKNREIISLITPMKTGTSTLEKSLENTGINVLCHHFIGTTDDEILCTKYIRENCKKYILGVRDPISQNISLLFQLSKWLTNYDTTINSFDIQSIFDKMVIPLILHPEDELNNNFSYRYINSGNKDISIPAARYFIQNYFDEVFNQIVGFDIFDFPFDTENGYSIISNGDKSVLIYQVEKLNSLEPVFIEFLKNPQFKLINTNEARNKYYYKPYKDFLQNVTFSEEYFEKSLSGRFIRHFYSKEDVEKFKNKWSSHILK